MVEKAVDIEAKTSLQPPFETKEIDSRCPKSYKLLVKKDKDKTHQEHRNGNKTKLHNLFLTNTNQPQTQAFKKDKLYKRCQKSHPATEVNATEVAKKNKDKAKNLNHIKYYTCK